MMTKEGKVMGKRRFYSYIILKKEMQANRHYKKMVEGGRLLKWFKRLV